MKGAIFYRTGCTNKSCNIGFASIVLGKRKPALLVSETLVSHANTQESWTSRAKLHRAPLTRLVPQGTSQRPCEGCCPGSGYLYAPSAKHSYGGCCYTCTSGFCANTANSGKVRHRHLVAQLASKPGTPRSAGSHLHHPDSHSYANRNLTFPKVLSVV